MRVYPPDLKPGDHVIDKDKRFVVAKYPQPACSDKPRQMWITTMEGEVIEYVVSHWVIVDN